MNEKKNRKRITDISTSILSISQVVFCHAKASVLMFGKCKQFRYHHKSICRFHLLLHFGFFLNMEKRRFLQRNTATVVVFSVFPVFSVWFEEFSSLSLSVCISQCISPSALLIASPPACPVPYRFRERIQICVKKPSKCDYVAVCRDMW